MAKFVFPAADEFPTSGFIAHLDGTRNREALLNLMMEGVRTGRVDLPNHKAGKEAETRELIHNQL